MRFLPIYSVSAVAVKRIRTIYQYSRVDWVDNGTIGNPVGGELMTCDFLILWEENKTPEGAVKIFRFANLNLFVSKGIFERNRESAPQARKKIAF